MLDILSKAAWVAAFCFVGTVILLAAWSGTSSRTQPVQEQHVPKPREQDKPATKSDNTGVFRKLAFGTGNFIRLLDRHNGLVSAIGTLFIAIFTLVLFIATAALFYSSEKVADAAKKSADAAKISADAARDSINFSRESLVATQRGFIDQRGFESTPVLSLANALIGWAITMKFENVGQTEARNLTIFRAGEVFDNDIPETFQFDPPDSAGRMQPTTIGKGVGVETPPFFINLEDIEKIRTKKARMLFWGRVEYDDIFKSPTHHFQFCFEIIVAGDPQAMGGRNPFLFTLYNRFNFTD